MRRPAIKPAGPLAPATGVGVTIGVVTGVQGISWTEVTITGQSAHAGTTPMQLRRDPLAVAARAIHEIRLIAGYFGAPQVATVGMLDVVPNLVNVIPSTVTFTIDLRNTDEARLKEAEAEVFAVCRAYASDEGGEIMLINANIPEYFQAGRFNHEPKRTRKLLLKKKEIAKLIIAVQREGMTIVPLKMYFNEKGRAKLEIALAKGKKLHDKRDAEKKRDWSRDKQRLLRDRG